MLDFSEARHSMIVSQMRPCDVSDAPLLDAVNRVTREKFVPDTVVPVAYADQSVTIQTSSTSRFMLQPMVVAKMIQSLNVRPGMKVLDIACGYGYSSAILAEMGAIVTALESDETLAQEAQKRLSSYKKVSVLHGSLEKGALTNAPYDAVLIHGIVPVIPEELIRQLKDTGILVCFRGVGQRPHATLFVRNGKALSSRQLFDASAQNIAEFSGKNSFSF